MSRARVCRESRLTKMLVVWLMETRKLKAQQVVLENFQAAVDLVRPFLIIVRRLLTWFGLAANLG